MKNVTLCFFLAATLVVANAQTLVNLSWQDTIGHPLTTLPYEAATTDAAGNFIIGGSTYTTGAGVATLLAKYNNSGTLLWETVSTDTIIGAYITVDIHTWGNDVYLTGMKYDSATSKSTIFLFKYNTSTGAFIWNKTYSGSAYGYDIAAAVNIDDSGYVYIAGSDQKSATESQMVVIRYDSSGNQKWVANYDTTNMFTGATALALTHTGTTVTVTGFSGTGFGSWSFVTTTINRSTGSVAKPTWASNGNGSFSSPSGVGQDVHGRVYIVGTATENGANTDIKAIAYDSSFNERWLKTWGNADSLVDSASRMFMDAYSNILITGYTTASNGTKQLLVLKYNNADSLLWSRTIGATNPTYNSMGNDITADASLNIYVTGKVWNGSNYDFITLAYDPNGNLLWQRNYDGGNTNDIANDIILDSLGNVYVTGTTISGSSAKYVTLKYQQLHASQVAATDTSGHKLYLQNQVIIKFDTSAIITSNIYNTKVLFGQPSFFLRSAAIDTLSAKISGVMKNGVTFSRVYKRLTPGITYSISRLGDTVPVPTLWSTLIMYYTGSLTPQQIIDSLGKASSVVAWSAPNYILSASSAPNDTEFYHQRSLSDASGGDTVDIQVEPVWTNYQEFGKRFIKVGIIDGNLDRTFDDFGGDNNSLFDTMKIGGGWDFCGSGSPNYSNHYGYHANAMAGVIGAISNNTTRMTGIAGGNSTSPSDVGVSLYGMTMVEEPDEFIFATAASLADGIVESSVFNPDSAYGFGLNLLVTAYNYNTSAQSYIGPIFDAFHLASRNQVTTVVSAGNCQYGPPCNVLLPPSNSPWVIAVGGTDYLGHWWLDASYGSGISLSAPADERICWSLFANTTPDDTFSGTSSASAHVTGVAGLLMSYLDSSVAIPNNLSPEDVQNILQLGARDVITSPAYPGYDTLTGWGELNAHHSFQLVDKANHIVKHVNTDSSFETHTITTQLVDSQKVVQLSEAYLGFAANSKFLASKYRVTVSFNYTSGIPSGDSVIAGWARSSVSNLFGVPDTISGVTTISPYENVVVTDSATQCCITLTGYYYHMYDTLHNSLGYIPNNLISADTLNHWLLQCAFTLLIHNPSVTQLQESPKIGDDIILYPNPAASSNTMLLNLGNASHVTIQMVDGTGRLLKIVTNGDYPAGVQQFTNDIQNLAEGLYIYKVTIGDNNVQYLKFVKM